jgi:exonuclease SbcC
LDARATRLATQVERRPILESEAARATSLLEQAQARVTTLGAVRDKLAFSEDRYEELRARADQVSSEMHNSELEAVAAMADASAALAALQRAEHARDEHLRARNQLQSLDRKRRVHDELDRAFTDLRTDLNADLRPEIGDIASVFVKQLTDNRYDELQLDETYTLTLLEGAVPKPVISGGEQDIANLCLRLAISQMIAERAGQSFSLLVLDEVFGSLDESRRSNVVELLRGLHDQFEQVILITHIEHVRDGLDRVISVRYDEETGSSVVSQSDVGDIDALELEPAEVGD